MNDLSLLIYVAGIANNIHGTLIATALVIAVLSTIFLRYDRSKALGLFAAMLTVLIASLIPDKQTIMMIAASEFGEEIAISAEAKNLGGKAYQSLDKFLSDYLEAGQE